MNSFDFSLVSEQDLTPYLAIGRPRDMVNRVLTVFAHMIPRGNPFWDNIVGGDALQQCIKLGIITYRFMIFKRT